MKSILGLSLACWLSAPLVAAFPSVLSEAMIQIRSYNEARGIKPQTLPNTLPSKRQAGGAFPNPHPPFDPKLQYVSNQGAHKFVAPSGNDQRGPCPGLNAMANHGYLPHNGIGTLTDFVKGTADAFGMAPDLSGFLAVYGAVFDGDLTRYSIGGPYPGLTVGGLNLLGQPQGLSGSHNKYEGDISPTRGDLYQYGNSYKLVLKQFNDLYKLGQENGDRVDLPVLTKYRYQRFTESVNNNPYFFNAPFSGVIASPAAWSFIYRFMANKTAEQPEGILDGETLKAFHSITGDYPNFKYTPGYERIPDNWYKRHPTDYYSIPYLQVDSLLMTLQYPQFATLGGNTGKPNSFVGIDPGDLTYGTYNSSSILEGNNLICYGIQASFMQGPDFLTGLYSDIDPAVDALGTAVNKATNALGCPQLNKINKGQFDRYPGFTKLKKDGTY